MGLLVVIGVHVCKGTLLNNFIPVSTGKIPRTNTIGAEDERFEQNYGLLVVNKEIHFGPEILHLTYVL